MPNFDPPAPFDFAKPAEWPTWRQWFICFRAATRLFADTGDVQVSALIYAMGSEAEHIFNQFDFPTPQLEDRVQHPANDFDMIMAKFDAYFTPVVNRTHDRAVFNQLAQHEEESVEMYIRSLFELSKKTCDFHEKKEAIRDRLIVGIRNRGLAKN